MPLPSPDVVHTGMRALASGCVVMGSLLLAVPLVFPVQATAADSDSDGEVLPDRIHAGQVEKVYLPAGPAPGDVFAPPTPRLEPPVLPGGLLPELPEPEPATAPAPAAVPPSVSGGAQAGGVLGSVSASARESVAEWCPEAAPSGVLRDGADKIGVRVLCEEAVKDARTVEAAKAVVYAFSKLGTPYSQELRHSEGFFDCSSLVYRAYMSAGVTRFFSNRPYTGSWADSRAWSGVLTEVSDGRAGDIRIMWEPGASMAASAGAAGHAQILLGDGWIIQSGGGGDSRVNVARDDTWGWGYQDFAHAGTGAGVGDVFTPSGSGFVSEFGSAVEPVAVPESAPPLVDEDLPQLFGG